ncbi:hypothetical protein [Comamonas sp.]|uniref:hypothetical protein n=1 Tax=Comamonas sp. TaxID=34028 RepID=UPI0028ABBE05|nr:hypothetical protein [Comamonas sp.]
MSDRENLDSDDMFELWWADHMPKATRNEAWAAWLALHHAGAAEFTNYLRYCDICAITPDVGGAWAHAFRAGAKYSAASNRVEAPLEVQYPEELSNPFARISFREGWKAAVKAMLAAKQEAQ